VEVAVLHPYVHDRYGHSHARRCRSSPTGAAPVTRADTAGPPDRYLLLCRVLGFDLPGCLE